MPKYYCDYCDIYLTHDSPSVRKSHNDGWRHKLAVRTYYQQFEPEVPEVRHHRFGGPPVFTTAPVFNNPNGGPPGGPGMLPPPGFMPPFGAPPPAGFPGAPPPGFMPPPGHMGMPPPPGAPAQGGEGAAGAPPTGFGAPPMGMPPGGMPHPGFFAPPPPQPTQ